MPRRLIKLTFSPCLREMLEIDSCYTETIAIGCSLTLSLLQESRRELSATAFKLFVVKLVSRIKSVLKAANEQTDLSITRSVYTYSRNEKNASKYTWIAYFCLYKILILSYSYRLTNPLATPARLWAAG